MENIFKILRSSKTRKNGQNFYRRDGYFTGGEFLTLRTTGTETGQ
jgi:hypothetical protein